MTDPISPEQHRDRPRLIKSIRTGLQRFQIAVYLTAIVAMAIIINFFTNLFSGGGEGMISLQEPTVIQTVTTDTPPKEEKPNPVTPSPVIEVLIENETLFLMSSIDGEKKQTEISLADLIEKAKQATGNSEGTKVRVLRKKSAKKVIRLQLQEALNKAVGTEAQRWPEELID